MVLIDTATLDADSESTLQEMDVVARMIQQMVNENAAQAQSQTAYTNQYNSLVERFENLQSRYDALQQQKERRQIQVDAIGNCLVALEKVNLLDITFSEALWTAAVDHVTVYADGQLVFHFKNGSEVTVQT